MSGLRDQRRFSYSALQQLEICPKRFHLANREYPAIWAKPGFPSRVTHAAVRGLVIHRCIEMFALEVGRSSGTDDPRLDALRALGGYTSLIELAMTNVFAELEENPRSLAILTEMHRRLVGDQELIRFRVQQMIGSQTFPRRERGVEVPANRGLSEIRFGFFPEFHLSSQRMPLHGYADLLVCDEPHDRIIDFKTGAPTEAHESQLRLYSALWLEDRRNVEKRPVSMVAIYGDSEVDFGLMFEADAACTLDRWKTLIDSASAVFETEAAEARPSAESCSYCGVKPVCSAYWEFQLYGELDASRPHVDVEFTLAERLGPRSWRADLRSGPTYVKAEVVHFDQVPQGLVEGDQVRVLGAFFAEREADVEPSLRIRRLAEIFVLRDGEYLLPQV